MSSLDKLHCGALCDTPAVPLCTVRSEGRDRRQQENQDNLRTVLEEVAYGGVGRRGRVTVHLGLLGLVL